MLLKKKLLRNLSALPGSRTAKKIIVIESDDWGSIRMQSLGSLNRLEAAGLDLQTIDAERYNRNDSLESSEDLEFLFETLSAITDYKNQHPIFTALCVVANPDFDRIRSNVFRHYFFETVLETFKKQARCERSFYLWEEGARNKLFFPQMHGREHLNVKGWMHALNIGDKHTLLAFDEGVWGFVPHHDLVSETDFQAAFLLSDPKDLDFQKKVIIEGLNLFETLMGYKAEYFVPPNGVFNNSLNTTLADNGIKYRSTSKIQIEPIGFGKTRKKIHWLGQRDDSGIRYIIRNCFFEPSQPGKDWVDSCLYDIKVAFRWNKPAIISSHRVNYMGSLNPRNRANGLKQLDNLLSSIVRIWPDIEFMTTTQLGNMIF